MTRILLIILLFLSSGPVYAEWVKIGESYDGTAYADPDTIRRKGDRVKMWQLNDFRTVETTGDISYLSIKSQKEHDCAEDRSRALAITWFLGNMGSGKVVYSSSDEQKWEPVEPRSVGQALWKVACSKK